MVAREEKAKILKGKRTLKSALEICKGRKGCDFAECIERQTGKIPFWARGRC